MNLIIRTALVMSLSAGALATLLTLSNAWIARKGHVIVKINGLQEAVGETSATLLSVLHENDIPIPSPCAGRGTCKKCRVHVITGAGEPTEIEKTHLTPEELDKGFRLACQLKLTGDLEIEIDPAFLQNH